MLAHPSIPAARAFLVSQRQAVLVRYNGSQLEHHGFSLYFTVVLRGGRSALIVKVCEDTHGHVSGSSSVSDGEPSC